MRDNVMFCGSFAVYVHAFVGLVVFGNEQVYWF